MTSLDRYLDPFRTAVDRVYERVLEREISASPDHVAVIQDGNRRYATQRGKEKTEGHKAGAETTEQVLRWCDDLGINELTLYAFSIQNFHRPPEECAALFDLIAERLRSFADQPDVHDREVRIKAIGATGELPTHVQEAIDYAETQTDGYDRLTLNVALAYGGRNELLGVTQALAAEAAGGSIRPSEIDVDEIERRLMGGPTQPVDLIIRTGGECRTSNFLPWHASGNEAAVYFCTPYWPAFSRADLLRAIRTYEAREESWRQSRIDRATTLIRVLGDINAETARELLGEPPRLESQSETQTDD